MNLSDDSLLAGMAMGDAVAAAAFVRRYQPRVCGLALTIVRSNTVAEEVAQEAFLRIWRSATAYDARRGQVGTWVLTITRNLAIDALRLRGNHERPLDPQALTETLLSREERESRSTHIEDKEHLRSALRASSRTGQADRAVRGLRPDRPGDRGPGGHSARHRQNADPPGNCQAP